MHSTLDIILTKGSTFIAMVSLNVAEIKEHFLRKETTLMICTAKARGGQRS